MSEIVGVTGVDGKNTYSGSARKASDAACDFASYLGETKTMDEIFGQAAQKYNVPVELLKAIGKAESNFNANAVSRSGAQGVMQLMPATARELGVTDSFDAEQNIMGGAKYIAALLKKYDGDTRLALAAYNAGSGNVAKYDGIPPFKETQNYVKKVIGYMGGDIQITLAKDQTSAGSGNSLITSANNAPTQKNYAYILTNDTEGTGLQDLDYLFSYDDYMKFIEMFLKEEKEEETKEDKASYSANEINYNAPVINLLKDQNLF
jgi:hypothetical protein